MDGVIYHGELLPGVKRFVEWLRLKRKFYVLTNSSQSAKRVKEKRSVWARCSGIHFYTSVSCIFLSKQQPNGSAYVIGESGR